LQRGIAHVVPVPGKDRGISSVFAVIERPGTVLARFQALGEHQPVEFGNMLGPHCAKPVDKGEGVVICDPPDPVAIGVV